MATAYIQESYYLISLNQSRLLKAIIFLWTYQTTYISNDLGHMDKAGIVDCAFIATAHRGRVLLESTHLFTLSSFGGLSLRRTRSNAGYPHELTLGIQWVVCMSVRFFAGNLNLFQNKLNTLTKRLDRSDCFALFSILLSTFRMLIA